MEQNEPYSNRADELFDNNVVYTNVPDYDQLMADGEITYDEYIAYKRADQLHHKYNDMSFYDLYKAFTEDP